MYLSLTGISLNENYFEMTGTEFLFHVVVANVVIRLLPMIVLGDAFCSLLFEVPPSWYGDILKYRLKSRGDRTPS